MPIARIITSMPELSGGLVRDLNSRGFEVHIISPEQKVSGTADLEIRLEAMSRPASTEVPTTDIPVSTSFSVPEPAVTTLPQPTLPPYQEDIWIMLAAFEGDAATQDAVAQANLTATESQEAIATSLAFNENSAGPSGPAEGGPSVTQGMAEPVDRGHAHSVYHVDPDLVPSMFNFSSCGEDTAAEQETAPSKQSPWRGSELRKTNLRSADSRLPRVAAAAAGCAIVVILMALTFSHRHALPKAVNSPTQETRTTAPFHSVQSGAEAATQAAIPIKPAVLVSTVSSSPKVTRHGSATEAAVAEDTIVRYGSVKKTPEASSAKSSAVRYYSDMD